MWNPDEGMRVDIASATVDDQERFDKAAARRRLVFEDALFHIVGRLIGATSAARAHRRRGTEIRSPTCTNASRDYTSRCLRVPGGGGEPVGATYQKNMANGAPLGAPLRHAFHCGVLPPTNPEIQLRALRASADIGWEELGHPSHCVADLLAYCIARGGILGLFQGPAETRPRALGHRSILANPCNPHTLLSFNRLVKFHKPFRPLAPMLTLEAAHRWFGHTTADKSDCNTYNYMVLTARPRPNAIHPHPRGHPPRQH